jgi:archaellum component FlaF (FlaF/FlaG flagellin family)
MDKTLLQLGDASRQPSKSVTIGRAYIKFDDPTVNLTLPKHSIYINLEKVVREPVETTDENGNKVTKQQVVMVEKNGKQVPKVQPVDVVLKSDEINFMKLTSWNTKNNQTKYDFKAITHEPIA